MYISRLKNRILNKALLRTVSLDSLYGDNLKKTCLIPPETVDTIEAKKMPFRSLSRHLQKDSYTTPPIFTTELSGVYYIPKYSIVLTKDRKIILESLVHNINKSALMKYLSWQDVFDSKAETITGWCSIFQANWHGYYHTLVDSIPRSYLLNNIKSSKLEKIKLLCCNEPNKIEKYLIPKIAPANVELTSVSENKLYYLEKLILPTFLTEQSAGYLPSKYVANLHNKVSPKFCDPQKNRIFISRIRRANSRSKRHILNEKELFYELKKRGFKKCILEDLSIDETIKLFHNAETVVAAHGAGLSNIMFSKNINVLELHPLNEIAPFYYFLSKSLKHNYYYWCSHTNTSNDSLQGKHTNFSVDIPSILKILDTFICKYERV